MTPRRGCPGVAREGHPRAGPLIGPAGAVRASRHAASARSSTRERDAGPARPVGARHPTGPSGSSASSRDAWRDLPARSGARYDVEPRVGDPVEQPGTPLDHDDRAVVVEIEVVELGGDPRGDRRRRARAARRHASGACARARRSGSRPGPARADPRRAPRQGRLAGTERTGEYQQVARPKQAGQLAAQRLHVVGVGDRAVEDDARVARHAAGPSVTPHRRHTPADPRPDAARDLFGDRAGDVGPLADGQLAPVAGPEEDDLVTDRDSSSPTSIRNWSIATRPTIG